MEAAPVNCTDPEKLPPGLVVAGVVVLDATTFLQLPKDAPAWKKCPQIIQNYQY